MSVRIRRPRLKSPTAHKGKSDYNLTFATFLMTQSNHHDWIMNAFFYSALHRVNAVQSGKLRMKWKTMSHKRILNDMATQPIFSQIGTDYIQLYTESLHSRYNPDYSVSAPDLQRWLVLLERINAYLDTCL